MSPDGTGASVEGAAVEAIGAEGAAWVVGGPASDTSSITGISTFCQSSPSSTVIAINAPTLISGSFSGF